jgi:hypothetical protein
MIVEYTIIDAATGLLKRYGTCPDTQFQHQCAAGELIIHGAYADDRYWWDGSVMQQLPPRPGLFYRFNTQAKAWEDSRSAPQVRAAQQQAIEAERVRRSCASPMAYAGLQLAADAPSADKVWKRVDAVRLQVDRGGAPQPSTLTWNDVAGQAHAFATVKAFRDFIEGFAIALDQRSSDAAAWAAGKQAALQAIGDDVAALKAFDPTS